MTLKFLEEGTTVEYKMAKGQFPKTFWDTYSSFSNTEGGDIYLGVSESDYGYEVTSLVDAQKFIQIIVDTANDKQFTNFNNIKV